MRNLFAPTRHHAAISSIAVSVRVLYIASLSLFPLAGHSAQADHGYNEQGSLQHIDSLLPTWNATQVEWKQYADQYWAFKVSYPKDWTVQNLPYKGMGFQISSPDLQLDPVGRLLKGAYFSVDVTPMAAEEAENAISNTYRDKNVTSEEPIRISGNIATQFSGITVDGHPFVDTLVFTKGYLYYFSFVSDIFSKDKYLALAIPMMSSLKLNGQPVPYPDPDYAALGINLDALNIPAIKHAFQTGPGKIISGYNHQPPPNQYAFDLCEGDQCSSSEIGDYLIAPTTFTLTWSGPGNNMPPTSKDVHIFELTNDGQNRLCMQIGHFAIRVPGFIPGVAAPGGAAIGTLIDYTPSIPHIHMGLWTIPIQFVCAGDPTARMGIPFEDPYLLDGVEYKKDEEHQGKSVNSTNVPFCWLPPQAAKATKGQYPSVTVGTGGCFPSDTTPPSGSFTAPSNGATISNDTVTISANAIDDPGGSGVREVNFSAKWNNQWQGIGTDDSAPYSIEWDMCAAGVPDGDIELGLEVWDNANNQYVYSEHNPNPHITKQYDCNPPPPDDGVELCDGINYGVPCQIYTFTSNDTCINLADSGMDNRVESSRFRGSYIGTYQVIAYEDNACGTYLSRFGEDVADFGLLNNIFSSVRIEQQGPPDVDGVELCDGTNYGPPCQTYTYTSNDTCINLADTGMDNRTESSRFRGSYIGNYDVIAYEDDACGTYLSRFGEDVADFALLNNLFSSIRMEPHAPPLPPSAPSDLHQTGATQTSITLSWQGNSNNEEGFEIERSPDGTTGWTQDGTAGIDVETYTDTGLNSGTTYYYRVRAYNMWGNSDYSTVISATTSGPPPPPAILDGHVTLQGRPIPPDSRWVISLAVTLTEPGTEVARYVFDPPTWTGPNGNFTLTGIEPGAYDVWVKSIHTLQEMVTTTLITGNNPLVEIGVLREGDADNDNDIDPVDFSFVQSSYNRCQGATDYDSRADFNQDTCVTLLDFSLLTTNFGQSGDSLVQTPVTVLPGVGPHLSISPSMLLVAPGQVFSVTIQVQAGAQQVAGAQAKLTFDPTLVRVRAITLGANLPISLKSVYDNEEGTISVAVGTLGDAPSGDFTLVQIQFEALSAQTGTVQLKFETGWPHSSDLAFDGASVLGSVADGKIIVGLIQRLYLPIIRLSR